MMIDATSVLPLLALLSVLLVVPAYYLSRRAAPAEAPAAPSTSPVSEDARRARFDDFEARVEARRLETAKRRSDEVVARDGGHVVGVAAGTTRLERDGVVGGRAARVREANVPNRAPGGRLEKLHLIADRTPASRRVSSRTRRDA